MSNLDIHTLFIGNDVNISVCARVCFTRFKKYICFIYLYVILMVYLSRVYLIVKVSFIGFG